MREIKFGIWTGENLIYFDLLNIDESSKYFRDENLHIIQFTGLHDKNGKEIYDSYVMLWPDEYKQVIWFNEKHTETSVHDIETSFGYHFDSQHPVEQGEVIGNIYENPELVDHEA